MLALFHSTRRSFTKNSGEICCSLQSILQMFDSTLAGAECICLHQTYKVVFQNRSSKRELGTQPCKTLGNTAYSTTITVHLLCYSVKMASQITILAFYSSKSSDNRITCTHLLRKKLVHFSQGEMPALIGSRLGRRNLNYCRTMISKHIFSLSEVISKGVYI